MDVAKLQLTIDGQTAVREVNAVEAALKALPTQATAAAGQVTAALNSIRTAAAALGTVQVNVNQTTQQAAQTAVNYSAALQQIQMQLTQTNALLNASVNSTNALGAAMANQARHTATATANTSQAAAATGSLNLNLASTLRTVGALVGIQFGAAALRELVVGSIQADIGMQRIQMTLEAVSGSAERANDTIRFLRAESDRIGVSFTDAATAFSRFSAATNGTSITPTQTRKIFTDISEAAARLHLSGPEVSRVFLALEQMASKGVVSMEELRRQLGNVIPGAFNLAARAAGMTTQEFNKMVKEGKVLAEDLLPKLAEEIRKAFPLGNAADATVADLNRMTNAWQRFKAEVGTGLRPVVQDMARGTAGFLDQTTWMMEQLRQPGGYDKWQDRARSQFPFAKGPWESGEDFYQQYQGPFGTFETTERKTNHYEIYRRMADDDKIARLKMRVQMQGVAGSPSRGGLMAQATPEREVSLTENEGRALERILELNLRLNAERLTGVEREKAMLDLTVARQLKEAETEIRKLEGSKAGQRELKARGIDLETQTLSILTTGDAAKARLDEEAATKKATEAAQQYLKGQEEINRVMSEIGGGGKAAEAAKINEHYRERQMRLLQIESTETAGDTRALDAMQALDNWRTRELVQLDSKYARHFIGEGNVINLMERRKQLEIELLTIHQDDPNGADRARAIQTEMRDLNQTVALQFQTGGVKAGEAFVAGLRRATEQWGNSAQRMAMVGQGVAASLESSFTNAFTSMLLGQKSVAQGFSDMANSIIADIARIVVQQSISIPIANAIMGVFSVGLGGAPASAAGTVSAGGVVDSGGFFQSNHRGGVVGMGGDTRTSTMAAFAFAPRYHGGGVVGDEVPIVARRGEVVFTPEQMQALGKAIGGNQRGASKVEIVNAFDETEVDRRIAANPGIVLNVISRNSAQVRRILT